MDFILTLLSSSMGRNLNSEEMGVVDDAVTKVYTENYALRKKLNGEEDIDDDYDVTDSSIFVTENTNDTTDRERTGVD